MNSTQQALWSMVVEIGGDAKLFAIAPNLRITYERAIEVLTSEGVIDATTGRLSEESNKWRSQVSVPSKVKVICPGCGIGFYQHIRDVHQTATPPINSPTRARDGATTRNEEQEHAKNQL